MRGELARLLFHLLRRLIDGDSPDCRGPATERADSLGHRTSISMDDRDIIQADAQLVGDDLRKGRLLPLPVRRRARQDRYFPGWLQAHTAILPHSLRSHGANLNVRR